MRLGYSTSPEREEFKTINRELNATLQLKKGDILTITKLNDATTNGEWLHDEVKTCEVTGIRKGKTGIRVAILDLKYNIGSTIVLGEYPGKIEIQ